MIQLCVRETRDYVHDIWMRGMRKNWIVWALLIVWFLVHAKEGKNRDFSNCDSNVQFSSMLVAQIDFNSFFIFFFSLRKQTRLSVSQLMGIFFYSQFRHQLENKSLSTASRQHKQPKINVLFGVSIFYLAFSWFHFLSFFSYTFRIRSHTSRQ